MTNVLSEFVGPEKLISKVLVYIILSVQKTRNFLKKRVTQILLKSYLNFVEFPRLGFIYIDAVSPQTPFSLEKAITENSK